MTDFVVKGTGLPAEGVPFDEWLKGPKIREIEIFKEEIVIIHRSRKPTAEEKEQDPEAKMMVETIQITFSEAEPVISINRVLCS